MPERDQSRLLVLRRDSGKVSHHRFPELLDFLRPGDLLVLNDSKVIPARLRAVNQASGGEFEVLLLEENATNDWWAMMRPGKRARVNTRILFRSRTKHDLPPIEAIVVEQNEQGHRRLRTPLFAHGRLRHASCQRVALSYPGCKVRNSQRQ